MHTDHESHMRTALTLAQQQLGRTWPNPSVGAVIVKNNQIIAKAATASGGRPHAETIAINMAGDTAKGATLYVTLEPCSHQGQTPPCVKAIIDAAIATVVIGCKDPNPHVNGKGIAQLKAAGIDVIDGICATEAHTLNRGFFSVIDRKRPFISLKIATSLDGKIATSTGQSKWITSETARKHGHYIRSQYDAVATGIGTVMADNPQLNVRLKEDSPCPVRIIFDSQCKLSVNSKLAQAAKDHPVWLICHENSQNKALEAMGVTLIRCNGDMRPDLTKAVELLAKQGITRLLIEAGSELSTAFLQSRLVDRMYWFRAPLVIGNQGLAAFTGDVSSDLTHAQRWQTIDHITLLPDNLEILECSPVS